MNGTHLLHSLTSRFLLRDAETRARRFGEVERRDFAVQLALARQKLDSAQVLWAHQQYVEGLRLAEESVTEALCSAELCQYILPAGTAIDDGAEPVSAQVLREFGSRPEHIQDALLCQRGLLGPRPTLNSQITSRERGYFQRAIQAAYHVVERLRPATRSPRDIMVSRWGRVATLAASFLVVVGLALATFKYSQSGKKQAASLHDRSLKDGFLFREDGSGTVHVVQGGTRFPIPSAKEFSALGYHWDNIEIVPPGSMAHLPVKPAEKSLLKERDAPTVYLYEGGTKRPIKSEAAFHRSGFGWSNVKVVPSGSLSQAPMGKPIE